jgi:acetyl esterase/lipase
MIGKVGAAAGLLLLAIAPGWAADSSPSVVTQAAAAEAFGAREQVEQISLSPDGSQVAYSTPVTGQGSILVVRGIADGSKPLGIMTADGKPNRIGGCGWVSNTRLVCTIYGVVDVDGRKVDMSRVFAVDSDGKNLKQLSNRENIYSRGTLLFGGGVIDWLSDEDGAVLMVRDYLPDDHTGSQVGSTKEGLGVDRIDTRTLAATSIEQPKRDAASYIGDGRGSIRIMLLQGKNSVVYLSGVRHYFYRRPGASNWEKLSDYDADADGEGFDSFQPLAVDRDLNVAYGLKAKDGRAALYSLALDGSHKETLIFDRPDVDVGGVVRIGRRNRVIGAYYQTDTPQASYFDPNIEKLVAALGRAMPKTPNIRVLDSSLDERKLLIFAGADDDPGTFYLLNRDTHEMHAFLRVAPQLNGVPLSLMKPIQYRASDGTMIPAYLTLPPGKESGEGLPAIVMPHGGPASRDQWTFDWLPQFYASQGYAVIQPEFRGSAGYGDAWFKKNGFRSWRTAIGDVVDAGRWLVAQRIADPARLFIVGWSYGGYAALQSAVMAPDLFKAVVAIAPVTDLALLKTESTDWDDELAINKLLGDGPEMQAASPAQNASKIKVPVLLVHGTMDANVGYHESTLMESKLRAAGGKVQLITFPGLDHQLEDSDARKRLLEESDAFLRASISR